MTSLDSLGLPKAKLMQLKKKGWSKTEDLLNLEPLHYYDFTQSVPVAKLEHGQIAAVYVQVALVVANDRFVKVFVQDQFGTPFEIVFFQQYYMAERFKQKQWFTVGGKVTKIGSFFNFTNPTFIKEGHASLIQTKYTKVKNMSEDYLQKTIKKATEITPVVDALDEDLRKKFRLVTKQETYSKLHQPGTIHDVQQAKRRLLFEDLFQFQIRLAENNRHNTNEALFELKTFEKTKELTKKLPFQLTTGQSSALREISRAMKQGKRVNSLIQGDVGCGKTIVSVFSMLMTAENGFQAAIMAPTNVLAKQHFAEMKGYFEPLGFPVVYLSGELKAKEKRETLKKIKEGEARIVVGTHSVISKDVTYKELGCIIIDEEHRFGVKQRETFAEKGAQGVHVISMSATPIPRTLAMTLYGEDVLALTIETMPNGRKPIQTKWTKDELKTYELIEKEIKSGHQAYIVCPLIEESEEMEEVESVERAFESAKDYFEAKGITVGMINGRMKPEVITEEIGKFADNTYQVLVSTTIIEVGVNVPNATVICIKSAERFGLAQLHQLRGRVGRSTFQSHCVLLSNNETANAEFKLGAMVDTADGFEIAKRDMQLRGTGDISGTEQSGTNKFIQLMLQYPKMNTRIQQEVKEIQTDPSRWMHYRNWACVDEEEEA